MTSAHVKKTCVVISYCVVKNRHCDYVAAYRQSTTGLNAFDVVAFEMMRCHLLCPAPNSV